MPHSKFYALKSQCSVLTPYLPTPLSILCLRFFLTSIIPGRENNLAEKKKRRNWKKPVPTFSVAGFSVSAISDFSSLRKGKHKGQDLKFFLLGIHKY